MVGKKILGNRLAYPLDGNVRFFDGRPLFGTSKTVRGIFLGVGMPAIGAPLLGLDWRLGAVVGSGAMVGDIISSFVKRRFDYVPSSRATGLDQIPESLLPLIACRFLLPLTVLDIAVGTLVFFLGEVGLSRLLYKVHLRDRPY